MASLLEELKKGFKEVPTNIQKDVKAIPGQVKELGQTLKGRAKSAKKFVDAGGLSPAELMKKGKENYDKFNKEGR